MLSAGCKNRFDDRDAIFAVLLSGAAKLGHRVRNPPTSLGMDTEITLR